MSIREDLDTIIWERTLGVDTNAITDAILSQFVVIPKPHVNHKGPNDNEAAIYKWAARTLDSGYELGGSNVRQSVAKTLRDVAASLEGGGI